MKKLTKARDRLDSLAKKSDSDLFDQLKRKLGELRKSTSGAMDELMESLRKGDFSKAKAELDNLAKKLDSGELSDEERAALEQQLEELARQLEELAKKREELEDALREAGLDPSLAQDLEALQKALEQNQNLTEAQRRMLRDLAQATDGACKRCSSMAQAAASAAQNMQGGSGAMSEMGEQLSQMEMMQQQMSSIEAARMALQQELNNLSKQMGQCQSSRPGDNPGGRQAGIGSGVTERDPTESPADFNKVKTKSKYTPGPMIGSTMVQGDQVRGESKAEFQEAVKTGAASAAESIESQQVPRELHDAVKKYFGRLEEQSAERPRPAPEPAESSGE